MKVGDLVKSRYDESYGIIIAPPDSWKKDEHRIPDHPLTYWRVFWTKSVDKDLVGKSFLSMVQDLKVIG